MNEITLTVEPGKCGINHVEVHELTPVASWEAPHEQGVSNE